MPEIINLIGKINTRFNNELEISEDKPSVVVKKEQLLELMRVLKDDIKYVMLADMTAVDYNDYFELIYHVMNTDADLLEIKARLEKDHADMPSLTPVWKAADVQEREIYDLMGISFSGHGNLRRILCKDDFEGHPLRKDFKLDIVSRF